MSPIRYLRNVRFAKVREALLRAEGATAWPRSRWAGASPIWGVSRWSIASDSARAPRKRWDSGVSAGGSGRRA